MDIEHETILRNQFGNILPHSLNVGNGWKELIRCLCISIREISDPQQPFRIERLKEKFGLLYVYITPSSAITFELSHLIWNVSASICEDCGNAGKPVNVGYWLKTLCEKCLEKRLDPHSSF